MDIKGLTDKEVKESRAKFGSNEIPDSEPTTFWQEFKETFQDPMIKILLAIAVLMIVMFFFGYAEIYEPMGTIIAVLIVAFVTAKTGVASDTKYRELKESTKKDQCKVHRNGVIAVIDVDDVVVGDQVLLQSGDKIPADGILHTGNLKVNNSALNGEAEECEKKAAGEGVYLAEEITGDTFVDSYSLFRGAVIFDGEGIMDVQKVGLHTMMGKMAEEMQEEEPDSPLKVKLSKLADQISKFGYIGAIVIAVMYFVYFIIMAGGFQAYFSMGPAKVVQDLIDAVSLAVVIIVCAVPEGLPLMISLVLMQNTSKMLDHNVLVRKAEGIETAGSLNILFSDKTGTITKGEPQVTDLVPADGISEEELLTYAYALEKKSEHPLAKAILAKAEERQITAREVSDFQALPGNGLRAVLDNEVLTGGSMKYISNQISIAPELILQAEKLAGEGKTPLLFTKNNKLIGMIAVADVMKEDSPQAVKELQNMGIRVVMLTGDNERTAKAIGAQAGVDEVIAGVLPDGKESVIRSLKEQGRVAMVGDGINDAPALTRADIGIAIGAGTDVAIDAADVVLMKSRLSDVPAAIRLSRATLKNIHENLFWAFFYNVIGIPLAAGVWIPIFGWTLNPMFGAAAMSLSSFCVVTNALRLNLFKVHDSSKDKKIKQNEARVSHIAGGAGNHTTGNSASDMADNNINNNEIHDHKDQENKKENKENKGMTTITVNVTGMMCGHCEAHVNKAVKEAFGVEDVVSSHEKGTTVIHAPEKLDEDKIREVIKEAGYEVTGITQE